ncbi:MAG TPA: glycosyltransferase family 9 protein [Capsulimonadaceae bacterium]|jgi:ADP-heptose:LPS heptosyltransferase
MKKILVVNMNYLGDALMTTPVHAALRQRFPDATIDAIAGSQQGYGAFDILAHNPHINNLIERKQGDFWTRSWQLLMVLIRGRYDGVVILPPIASYKIAAMLALTRTRLSVARQSSTMHMSDVMLDAIKRVVPVDQSCMELVLDVPAEDRESVRRLLDTLHGDGAIVGVNLGASRPQKRWPSQSFARLIEKQVALGRRIVLLGGKNPDDVATAQSVVNELHGAPILDLVAKTTVMELAAVVDACDVLVTADTGAMHIASAVRTPMVAIFGSTDPIVSGPYGSTPATVLYKRLSCSPCGNHPTCNGAFTCMSDVTPIEVGAAVDALIAVAPASV